MSASLRAELELFAGDTETELLFLEPGDLFDPAILGLCVGYGQEPAVLYDLNMVRVRMAATMPEATEDEVEEYLQFNTLGAFMGPATPRFLDRMTP